jgi:class 3 adenylate cyclase
MAARLEAATRQFQVPLLVSGSFHSLLTPQMAERCRRIDKVKVKGSAQPMPLPKPKDTPPLKSSWPTRTSKLWSLPRPRTSTRIWPLPP